MPEVLEINKTVESWEHCDCGGELDCLYLIQANPDIWLGRCFVCGQRYAVIKRHSNGEGDNALRI